VAELRIVESGSVIISKVTDGDDVAIFVGVDFGPTQRMSYKVPLLPTWHALRPFLIKVRFVRSVVESGGQVCPRHGQKGKGVCGLIVR
jgi:hypothetical protein